MKSAKRNNNDILRSYKSYAPVGCWHTNMKYNRTLYLIALSCFSCEHFADYRYEVSNHTAEALRVEIGFYAGKDTLHVDTAGAYTAKQVLTNETPITLGCNEDSPQNRGFDNISKFVITVIDSPSVRKDFKGSSQWSYRITDRIGTYSISISDSTFLK